MSYISFFCFVLFLLLTNNKEELFSLISALSAFKSFIWEKFPQSLTLKPGLVPTWPESGLVSTVVLPGCPQAIVKNYNIMLGFATCLGQMTLLWADETSRWYGQTSLISQEACQNTSMFNCIWTVTVRSWVNTSTHFFDPVPGALKSDFMYCQTTASGWGSCLCGSPVEGLQKV